MNLDFLDKSSKVTPLLVKLYDSQRLHGLAADKKPMALAELSSAICELLENDLSPRESELVADVMIGLMRQAELDLRQALAEKLAALDNVPLRLVLQMASDEICVAESVLKKSRVLTDLDLIYVIKSQSSAHWCAIAQRKVMSDQVMNMLADTGDLPTAIKLAENKNIKLSEYVLAALSDLAQGEETLATPLLYRNDVPSTVAQKLYQFVGQELKAYIESEYGITKGEVADALDKVLDEFDDASANESEFMPKPALINDAKRQKEKGLLTVKLMLASLRRGQVRPFIAQFAQFASLKEEAVIEIFSQTSGHGLAVACKAFDVSKEDFVSMFLLTNRMRSKGRMVELSDLSKAINYYSRVKKEMAVDILKNSSSAE